MKIFDCTLFTDEKIIFGLRLEILNKYIDKFIVSEASYTHSGVPKKLNFNIDDYPEFKNKITYIIVDELPIFTKDDLISKRTKSIKIISFQRNKLLDGLNKADNDDFIIYSDCDEIPNLKNLDLFNLKKITIFQQKIFYYKFNLELKTLPWYGTRGCKKKDLIDFEWLRQIKPKEYKFWRIDTIFKKDKYRNINIIKNGGWHFSQLKSPEDIFKKLLNDEHHDEFEMSGVNLEKIKDMVENQYIVHNHNVDKKDIKNKWSHHVKLEKVSLNEMPEHIYNNKKTYSNWIIE
jgi:beta-1,4-mannosyl-glycoprotein beta-1,4-N-acetylglucosaminyltransferase